MMALPDGSKDRGPATVAFFWALGLVAVIITFGRFYARSIIRATGADDWWMLITLVRFRTYGLSLLVPWPDPAGKIGFLVISGVVTYSASLGGFRHSIYVDPHNIPQVAMNLSIIGALGIFAVACGKVSVSCLILRLLPPGSVWYRRFLWFIMLSTTINSVSGIIFTFVGCNPPKAMWEPDMPHTCWDPNVLLGISYAGTSQ